MSDKEKQVKTRLDNQNNINNNQDKEEQCSFPEISKSGVVEKGQFRIERFFNVPFQVRVVLDRKIVSIWDADKYQQGGIIELNKDSGSPMLMTIYVNGVPLFYGEVVVIEDCFGIRITHIIDEKISSDNYLKDLNYTSEKARQVTKTNDIDKKKFKKRFYDVNIELRIEIENIMMNLKKILECKIGSFIELNKHIDEPLTVYGNNIPIAYGKIVLEDEHVGLQITDI